MLDALYSTLARQQGPLMAQVVPGMQAGAGGGYGAAAAGGGYGGSMSAAAAASAGGPLLDNKQAAVVAAFQRYQDSDEGAHTGDIERIVAPAGITREEVAQIIELLQTEGVVYSTTDEYHFKLTGEREKEEEGEEGRRRGTFTDTHIYKVASRSLGSEGLLLAVLSSHFNFVSAPRPSLAG